MPFGYVSKYNSNASFKLANASSWGKAKTRYLNIQTLGNEVFSFFPNDFFKLCSFHEIIFLKLSN